MRLQHHQEADRGGTRAPGRPQETADFLAGPACEGNGRARENPLRPQPFLLSAPSSARTAYSVGLGEIEEDGVPVGVPPGWAMRPGVLALEALSAVPPALLSWL